MASATDPMAVLHERAPEFSSEEAVAILRTHWGIEATVRPLVSERDQNFRVTATDGVEYVLKIANAAEPEAVTDFQIKALIHIREKVEALSLPIRAPAVSMTRDGGDSIRAERGGRSHVVRLVSFLPGTPLGDELPSPGLARNMGAYLANLGLALDGFSHPGSGHSLMWDIQQALGLRDLLAYVRSAEVGAIVSAALDAFEAHVVPVMSRLRKQVIHSDMNPDNVLLDRPGGEVVSGIIDFGDMLEAPLVADVAIAGSYLRAPSGDPLSLIAELLAGYHGVRPLQGREIDVLFELVLARICASIAILDWRAATREGDDPYLAERVDGVGSAEQFLIALQEIPRGHARQVFRQVCASVGDQALS
jgi:Ser/Thr protein kinase RdoA (MazF antagonist)